MEPLSFVEFSTKISTAVFQRFAAIRFGRMKKGLNPDKSPAGDPEYLAHYTTSQGLQGIVQNGNLWASAPYYLNDTSEIDYGCQLFTSLLTKLLTQQGLDPVPRTIFEMAKKSFEPGGFMDSVVARTYVACFCEDENLLSQWRTYGQSGGYSISFSRKALCELGVDKELYIVTLQRVIYDKKLQSELLELVLSDLLSIMLEPEVKDIYKTADVQGKQLFIVSFNSFLQTMASTEIVRFKHPAFAEEKEWRLIVRPLSTNLSTNEMALLKFRPSRGVLVPYLELRPKESTLLPVSWVRYGPTLEKKRVENSLKLLFKQKGYSPVPIHGSDIPVILS
jgi:hypothetical protein